MRLIRFAVKASGALTIFRSHSALSPKTARRDLSPRSRRFSYFAAPESSSSQGGPGY
jgi:hypothetical protein